MPYLTSACENTVLELLCRMKNSARTSTVWMLRLLDIGSPKNWWDPKGYMVTHRR